MGMIDTEEVQMVVFRLGAEEYGIPITHVQEIKRLSVPTKIPNAPGFVEGVINLRGKVVPVIDLKKRFGLEGCNGYTDDARIVIVEINGHTVGVIVDEVSEVLRLLKSNIDPPPAVIAGISASYLQGVGKLDDRLLILLDLDYILTESEKVELEEAEEAIAAGATG